MQYRYAIQICNADMQYRYATKKCNTDMQYRFATKICNTDMQYRYATKTAERGSDAAICIRYAIKNAIKKRINHMH